MNYNDGLHNNLIKLTSMNIIWSILGIILGVTTDKVIGGLVHKFNISNDMTKILIHLLACCIILSIIQTTISNYFGWSWQNITPGLFFISFYFGVQYNIFTMIQKYNR